MCGIVGYIGKQNAAPIILEGLRRLEYRGYDSAGLTVIGDRQLLTRKRKGKIDEGLAKLLDSEPLDGRWDVAERAIVRSAVSTGGK